MAEDKKKNLGGVPGIYWRYIAALAIATVFIYIWNTYFVTRPPEQYTINYSQFMEQLESGNIRAVSIKKLLVSGELTERSEHTIAGRKETRKGEIL